MYRVLLRLRKGESVKYISHLDWVRALEYAFRRAQLPIAYSEGFNPRPKMSFSGAIGVGVESEDERVMLELTEPMDPNVILDRLNARMTPDLRAVSVEAIPEGVKSPLSETNAAEYLLTLECPGECEDHSINTAIQAVLASPEVRVIRVREKGTQEVDIRPYLLSAAISCLEDRNVVIDVNLMSTNSGGARPQDFAQALERHIPGLALRRIRRIRQFHAEGAQ